MDWLTFFSSIVNSLAWPVTVVVIIWLLKDNISRIFPFIQKFKYKDFEIEFSRSIRELSEKSESAIEHPPENLEYLVSPSKDKLYLLAEVSPRSAILEAWLLVEMAAVEVIKKQGLISKHRMMGPLKIGQYLRKAQVLNEEQLEIYNKLRHLRNQAVHVADTSFNLDEVKEYIDLALSMAYQLEKTAQP
ncbi:MAG TPA: hypothetical protein ENJ28_07550 [Gammaproteobacteria bacterium]|nr:hypothetical protein [Gammaproteobacteria bacterium]